MHQHSPQLFSGRLVRQPERCPWLTPALPAHVILVWVQSAFLGCRSLLRPSGNGAASSLAHATTTRCFIYLMRCGAAGQRFAGLSVLTAELSAAYSPQEHPRIAELGIAGTLGRQAAGEMGKVLLQFCLRECLTSRIMFAV